MTLFEMYIADSWALVGLIWVIQLVHYPSFKFISKDNFLDFHRHHTLSISLIVMPLMLLELGLSIWIGFENGFASQTVIPLILVTLIWLSTFFIQIPIHQKLGNGKDEILIRKLVKTNWIRTVLWTLKGFFISFIL